MEWNRTTSSLLMPKLYWCPILVMTEKLQVIKTIEIFGRTRELLLVNVSSSYTFCFVFYSFLWNLNYFIDAKFWVGQGERPSANGLRIPDENGKENPLRRYDHKTIVLTLPDDLTVFDIGHFGVWCEAFTVDFGHVQIPKSLNVPPSLKMLGISPQVKKHIISALRSEYLI